MTYVTSTPITVVGTDIPTKLVGTVYFDKSCDQKAFETLVTNFDQDTRHKHQFLGTNTKKMFQET